MEVSTVWHCQLIISNSDFVIQDHLHYTYCQYLLVFCTNFSLYFSKTASQISTKETYPYHIIMPFNKEVLAMLFFSSKVDYQVRKQEVLSVSRHKSVARLLKWPWECHLWWIGILSLGPFHSCARPHQPAAIFVQEISLCWLHFSTVKHRYVSPAFENYRCAIQCKCPSKLF